jgi:two-component system, NarL family, response regulator DesR
LFWKDSRAFYVVKKNFRILAQCTTSEQTLRAVRRHRPDILPLDIHMPSKNGFDALRQMLKAKLPTRSVVFTATLNDHQTLELIGLGASGLVLKNVQLRMLIHCIRKVQAGEKSFERGSSVTPFREVAATRKGGAPKIRKFN